MLKLKMLPDKPLVERLIELVKEKPVLYDIGQRKNNDLKESTWQEIALELGVNETALKRKWKSLKDCYRKYLRANSDDESSLKVKSYRRWGWSQYLEFLRPHIDSSAIYIDETLYCDSDIVEMDDNNIKIENRNSDSAASSEKECYIEEVTPRVKRKRLSSIQMSEQESSEKECYIEEVTPRERKRRRLSSVQISEETRDERGLDAIEHIFLGYAKTIKTLPVKSQIYVKMKIAKLIMEEELKFLK